MKTLLFTTLAAAAGLFLAGFTLKAESNPEKNVASVQTSGAKTAEAEPACHTAPKSEANPDASASEPKMDPHAMGTEMGMGCCMNHAHDAGAMKMTMTMNCPMHAAMKGCSMGGSH